MLRYLQSGLRAAGGSRLPLLLVFSSAVAAQAPPPCAAYNIDLARELFIMGTPAIPLFAATGPADSPPELEAGREYHLILEPQSGVELAVGEEDAAANEHAHAGLAGFTVPEEGTWRISLSRSSGVHVIDANGSPVVPGRQAGQAACETLQKFVEFPLRAGSRYTLQLAGGPAPEVSVLISGPLESAD